MNVSVAKGKQRYAPGTAHLHHPKGDKKTIWGMITMSRPPAILRLPVTKRPMARCLTGLTVSQPIDGRRSG